MESLEKYASLVPNPVQKLKLINRIVEKHGKESKFLYRIIPGFGEIILRRLIFDELKILVPNVPLSDRKKVNGGRLNLYQRLLWALYPVRLPVCSTIVALMFVLTFWMTFRGLSSIAQAYFNDSRSGLSSMRAMAEDDDSEEAVPKDPDPIWLVDTSKDIEVYSNRLRINTSQTVKNIPRKYLAFPRSMVPFPESDKITGKVAGILYHTSESDILPLSEALNNSIKASSLRLISFIRRNRCYNYLIDRYGQVYRIVDEDQAAYHAGNSVWADDGNIYLNLNHAFIGICFEGKDFVSEEDGLRVKDRSSISDSQLKSAKELTDWLRFKYKIKDANCVTHGLASVSPGKMLIGFHMDLARGFPYVKMGLSDKYKKTVPSITLFGFNYDGYFLKAMENHICKGILLSVLELQKKAAENKVTENSFRIVLNSRYTIMSEWEETVDQETALDWNGSPMDESPSLPSASGEIRQCLVGEFQNLQHFK
jgi:hypothetical protein